MRKGVTLVEVVVSSLILAIAFGGLLSTFVAVRKYITRANKRLIASDLVSQTLNDLYRAVRSDEWDVGAPGGTYPLQTTAPGGINNYTIDGYNYNGNSYSVSSVAGADYRQVDIIIDYQ
ncbi:MAG: prepilin-type N-terminal cleavage/methylation domain-containing protein [Candidatus Susulua stagnicola]|nr:prepilin-type N-terminal cleavage/methylation domain-containing protein [Candidatus Susulua stagnicola]